MMSLPVWSHGQTHTRQTHPPGQTPSPPDGYLLECILLLEFFTGYDNILFLTSMCVDFKRYVCCCRNFETYTGFVHP